MDGGGEATTVEGMKSTLRTEGSDSYTPTTIRATGSVASALLENEKLTSHAESAPTPGYSAQQDADMAAWEQMMDDTTFDDLADLDTDALFDSLNQNTITLTDCDEFVARLHPSTSPEPNEEGLKNGTGSESYPSPQVSAPATPASVPAGQCMETNPLKRKLRELESKYGSAEGFFRRSFEPQDSLDGNFAPFLKNSKKKNKSTSSDGTGLARGMPQVHKDLRMPKPQFLRLQLEAKAFMFDPNYPERHDMFVQVGREKTFNPENMLSQVKIWDFAKLFMTPEVGLRYWGPDAILDDTNPLRWPRDRQQLMRDIMPLLYRQITNERQRLQNILRRRKTKASRENLPDPDFYPTPAPSAVSSVNTPKRLPEPEPYKSPYAMNASQDEPTLSQPAMLTSASVEQAIADLLTVDDTCLGLDGTDAAADNSDTTTVSPDLVLDNLPLDQSTPSDLSRSTVLVHFKLNFMHAGKRLLHHEMSTDQIAPDVGALRALMSAQIDANRDKFTITGCCEPHVEGSSVLATTGLRRMGSDEDWRAAVEEVRRCDWMDGEVRVLVNVVDRSAEPEHTDGGVVSMPPLDACACDFVEVAT